MPVYILYCRCLSENAGVYAAACPSASGGLYLCVQEHARVGEKTFVLTYSGMPVSKQGHAGVQTLTHTGPCPRVYSRMPM